MEFGSALRVLLRRWLVVLLGGLLTLSMAVYLYTSTPPTYRATAQMLLLLPSDADGMEDRGSPFLYLPNELNVLARVVASAPASQDFQSELLSNGLTSPYEVGVDPSSPIISVGVEGPDADNVLATRNGLVEAIRSELLQVQEEEDVPSGQTARFRVFAAETTPTQLGGSASRGVLAVLAAGGLLTLLAAFGVEGISVALRRRQRRSSERDVRRDPAADEAAPQRS